MNLHITSVSTSDPQKQMNKSDEVFYVIQGKLFVDLEDKTEELHPGEMITIPRSVRHRTRSNERTLILCFESMGNDVTGDQ